MRTLFAGACVVLLVTTMACTRTEASAPVPAAAKRPASLQPLPRLVDLGTGKCVSCKAMTPVLEGLRKDFAGKLRVDFIDVWENHAAAEPWRISMIPTQIFLSADGRELWRHEGFISRDDILAKFREIGVALD